LAHRSHLAGATSASRSISSPGSSTPRAQRFEDLVGELRRSAEWELVEREVDVRLAR
jgi:hypothetical protein